MTLLNISILLLVIVAGLTSKSVQVENWTPFAPQGVSGVVAGAGLVFFAFIGFVSRRLWPESTRRPMHSTTITSHVALLFVCLVGWFV